MRRLIAWALAAVVTAVTVPVGLLVLLMMVLLIVQPTIVSEVDRADALTWVLVEEGPPIRGSFDLDGKVIYLVLASDRHYPRWFIHGMGKAACQDAGLLAWPYALPGWTIAVRVEGDLEPTYSCTITGEVETLFGLMRRLQQQQRAD